MALVQMRNSSHAVYLAEFDQAELKRVTYNCGSLYPLHHHHHWNRSHVTSSDF